MSSLRKTTFMRILVLAPLFAAMLSGCATPPPEPNYVTDNLTQFAFELGATHAAMSQCEELSGGALSGHLETAYFALHAQAGGRDVLPALQQGLRHPEAKPAGLTIDCSCAKTLLEESRQHNLSMYRSVALPRAFRNSATQQ
jgi:hypothetical protein